MKCMLLYLKVIDCGFDVVRDISIHVQVTFKSVVDQSADGLFWSLHVELRAFGQTLRIQISVDDVLSWGQVSVERVIKLLVIITIKCWTWNDIEVDWVAIHNYFLPTLLDLIPIHIKNFRLRFVTSWKSLIKDFRVVK